MNQQNLVPLVLSLRTLGWDLKPASGWASKSLESWIPRTKLRRVKTCTAMLFINSWVKDKLGFLKMPFSFLSPLLQLRALCTAGLRLCKPIKMSIVSFPLTADPLFCSQLLCHGFGEVTCEEHVWEHMPWNSFYPAMEQPKQKMLLFISNSFFYRS